MGIRIFPTPSELRSGYRSSSIIHGMCIRHEKRMSFLTNSQPGSQQTENHLAICRNEIAATATWPSTFYKKHHPFFISDVHLRYGVA